MPKVVAYNDPITGVSAELLEDVCKHIVPAGMSGLDSRLTPGSIVFFHHPASRDSMGADVFIDIEAYDLPDRDAQHSAEMIGEALEHLFPGTKFAIWPKLVKAGWWREQEDPAFEGKDLSMIGAIARSLEIIQAAA